MPGYGLLPCAPIFVTPKTAEKPFFIFNCKLGNSAFDGPNPPMKLPNLFTLREKFVDGAVQRRPRSNDRFMVKLDLTNCYPWLKLPPEAWGGFRVQGSCGVYLRSLPFGWRLSPPICQETVAGFLHQLVRQLPLPKGYDSGDEVDFDHYLDDLLFVESDKEWLSVCDPPLADYLRIEGFVISQKSVLEPVQVTEWLGKIADLRDLSVSNSQVLHIRLFAALVHMYGRVVPVKLRSRVLDLI